MLNPKLLKVIIAVPELMSRTAFETYAHRCLEANFEFWDLEAITGVAIGLLEWLLKGNTARQCRKG